MKKSYNPISDVRNESVDLTKRLFRNISDAVHSLDDIRARANNVANLFTQVADSQRVKLRDCCERLIFCDKSGYGRKAEELLWRKGYYEVISTAKRLRKGNNTIWMPDEATLVHHHVLAGVGQYHHLLSRLQFDCGLDLRGITDYPVLYLDEGLKKGKSSNVSVNGRSKTTSISNSGDSNNTSEVKNNSEWAVNVAHRCLIYLGDLCRYLLDLQPGWDFGLPAHYYSQALVLKPEAGMPYNQLGTLAGNENCSLDAVYYYMRCMCCPHTFEGAEGNLIHALDKTARWLEGGGKGVAIESATAVSRLIARLLYLTRVWFCSKTSVIPLHKVCDEFLIDLPKCLEDCNEMDIPTVQQEIDDIESFLQNKLHIKDQPSFLTDEMVFKIVVILLMSMQQLEKKGSEEFMRVVALLLAVISQLLQQALQRLETILPPLCPPKPLIPKVAANAFTDYGLTKRRRRRRRRRRRGSSEGSSDLSEGDDVMYVSSSGSDISEEELVFDENNSDNTDLEDDVLTNGKATGENGTNHTVASDEGDDCVGSTKTVNSSEAPSLWSTLDKENEVFLHIHSFMQKGYLLQTIKICFDWLSSNMDVLRTCSQSGKTLVTRTATFLNYLAKVPLPVMIKTEKPATVTTCINYNNAVSDFEKKENNINKCDNVNGCSKDTVYSANEVEQLPSPEDILLRGLPALSWAHSKLVWSIWLTKRMTSEQDTYLRICKLVKLGTTLANDRETTGLQFDGEHNWFFVENADSVDTVNCETTVEVPTTMSTKNKKNISSDTSTIVAPITDNSANTITKQENSVIKHDKLMQDMGQLWLRAEVKELETKVKKTANHLPPYLVLDCDALTLHSTLVKQLAAARKFIMLIPTVVVSALDEQKRSSGRVRDTIRWLESEFRHGNRFLRAQRANEHLALPLMKYPKKKDKEAWLFFQVVECCHFLSSQGGGKDSGLVTLLTGSPTLLSGSNTSGFSPLGIVNSAGISIEHIESFHSKWKSSCKSHG